MTDSDSSWFSFRRFGVALGTVAIGTIGGLSLGIPFGNYLGALLGGFAAGLAFEHRPFLEAGIAGLVAGAVTVLLALLGGGIFESIIGLITAGPQKFLLAGVLSFGLAGLGAHFGNDFRDGLTRPVEE